jgi:glycosyltransferase involved in cell wall biosynthesis
VKHAEATSSYDIVCFSIINWEFRWQRPQQMMALWARRGRRVFYLRITDFLPANDKLIAVKPLAENVWEVRIALPKGFSFHSGKHPDGFATVGLEALRALREKFEINRAVAVVQFASWTPLACAAREAFGWPLVYDCMDDWSTFPGLSEQPPLLKWEEELLRTADRVVVSSRTIRDRWANRRADLLLARNAADFAFFQKTEGEDPLSDVEGPVAGFFGAIAEWFDRDLMASVAKARPEVTFVLVGGVHRVSVSELEKLPNVRFEGWQPYEKMPLYLRRFDVCLVPFEVSPATNGMDVVKLYEYLSQGKPVVATPIREILIYSALLYLAEDERSFVRQLDRALNENDPALRARRIELARQNTWDERLDRIDGEIRTCLASLHT